MIGGRYAIERELGRGGAALVYLARDINLDRKVAVKVLREEVAHAIGERRFKREIQIASSLRHPHIVPVLDFGGTEGELWYVMPYIENGSLRQRMERESQLKVEDSVRWGAEIAEALAYAHEHGFVHRDVKPENILLDGEHAFLADFGLARGMDTAMLDTLTSAGIAVGTPAYMSPEQGSGTQELDGRSDVYSLACVLYECFAGVQPFVGPTAQSVIAQRFAHAAHPVSSYRKTIPASVEELIESGMSVVAADRPSAKEICQVLRSEVPNEARISIRKSAERSVVKRNVWRPPWAVVGGVALIGIAIVGAWVWKATPKLDANKVVVFPLDANGNAEATQVASEIPILISASLERTPPLRWVEGGSLTDNNNSSDTPERNSRRLQAVRAAGARYFIDGKLIVASDSVTVVMRLMNAAGDSAEARASLSSVGGPAAARGLALSAVGQLLPRLLEPGRNIDLSPLTDRPAQAIGAFMLGERDFRQSRYASALAHYQEALAIDTSFALAALKAARTARSLFREEDAQKFVQIALAHEALLPGANALFARGLSAFYRHQGDSALSQLESAARLSPEWSEIYAAIGDVHFYIGVDGLNADSAAEVAYRRSRQLDSTFTPAIYHLIWLAARRHDPATTRSLLVEYERGGSPDTTFIRAATLAADCQTQGESKTDWKRAANSSPAALWMMGKVLVGSGADLSCSAAAFQAVFQKQGPPSLDQWGGLVGLNSIFVATMDTVALQSLAQNPMAVALRVQNLLLMDGVVESKLGDGNVETAATMMKNLSAYGGEELWLLGTWLAANGKLSALDSVIRIIRKKASEARGTSAQLMVESLTARSLLLRGDTLDATKLLMRTDPNASFREIEWTFFSSRAAENMLLAELAMHDSKPERAIRFAQRIDHLYPIANVAFLRKSLQVRQSAASALHNAPLQQQVNTRLSRLDASRVNGQK